MSILISTSENAIATLKLRPIQTADNEQVARIIRSVMTEFDCVGEGYSINDPEVDAMSEAYSGAGAAFFVIAEGDKIEGCGGIAPLAGGDGETCELKKMYFSSSLRGLGWGRRMVEHCLTIAKMLGYRRCYLETVARMEAAKIICTGKWALKLNALRWEQRGIAIAMRGMRKSCEEYNLER